MKQVGRTQAGVLGKKQLIRLVGYQGHGALGDCVW